MSGTKQRVAMSGASGFVGSHLGTVFEELNWDVVRLGRNDFQGGVQKLAERIAGADIIVNLAGAPVIGRWTEAYKKTMYESRIHVTKNLVAACSQLEKKPEVFISTSAVGYYAAGGPHTEENHTRDSGFLGNLARDWEKEALEANALGIRTVIFRFGIVIGKGGGALQQMLTPFKMGLGGTIGDGSQGFSWVHIKDLSRAYEEVIGDPSYEGIYNLTAPNPTTNKGLTDALGQALNRPTLLRIPKFVLQMQYSEGAQVLASGQKVLPERLLEKGFRFTYSEIEEAVRDCVS